jgi:hypothetical protein
VSGRVSECLHEGVSQGVKSELAQIDGAVAHHSPARTKTSVRFAGEDRLAVPKLGAVRSG